MSVPVQAKGIYTALRKGAKLIVIDPRSTGLASKADIWMQVRPGTDCALALGMLNVIINEGLYDKDFVDEWTVGFDKLQQHVQDYTPEEVEKVTWVPARLIREGARMFTQNKPASIILGAAGIVQHANSFQSARAITSLAAITGNLDIPGGNLHLLSPLRSRSAMAGESDAPFGKLSPEVIKKRLGLDKLHVIEQTRMHMSHCTAVWRAMLEGKPYPLKVMLSLGGNALIAYENSLEVKEALSKLDFFAVAGLEMTPTAEIADIVLPVSHWAERDEIVDVGNWAFCHQKAVEPPEECWGDRKILTELAKKLGLEGFWPSLEEHFNFRLEPLGLTMQQFREVGMVERPIEYKKYEKLGGFHTMTKKVELYSEVLEKMGYDPMPVHHEPPESPVSTPELAKDYPLILITGVRDINVVGTSYRHIASLRKRYPEPLLQIHPDTAKKLDIKDGDWVRIETPRGSVKHKAKLFDGLHPSVVATTFGWWYGYDNGWKEVNINVLTDNKHFDPQVGSTPIKSLLCRVGKV